MQPIETDFSFKEFFTPFTTVKAAILFFIIGFLVFGNALFNQFVWDELILFNSGDTYRSIANIGYIFLDHSMPYYRPLPFSLLALFYTFFGETTFWYHFFQIILHIVNTILVYILFKKCISKSISFFLATVFLIHPIQIESVSYIAAVQNPLSIFFGLASIFLAGSKRVKEIIKYTLLSLLLLLAILTKEIGFLFFLFIPLYILLVANKKISKREWYTLGYAYLAAIIPFIYLRFFITNIKDVVNTYNPIPIINASIYERLLTFPKIAFYYIATLIFPKDLAISQEWVIRNITLQNFFIPLLVVVCFFIFLVIGFLRVRNNSKTRNLYMFFLIWFILSWSMHWNIVHPLDMTVADRWFYLPMVGLLGIIGLVANTIKVKPQYTKIVWILVCVALVLLSIRTIMRNHDWKDPLTLYSKDSQLSTDSYDLEAQLGETLMNQGRYKEAKPHIDKAIKLAPGFFSNWTILGLYYAKTNQSDKAIQAYSQSIKLNKGTNLAYILLTDTYFLHKDSHQTKKLLEEIRKQHPSDPYFIYLQGIVEYRLGNKEKGMEYVLHAYEMTKNAQYFSVYNAMLSNKKL